MFLKLKSWIIYCLYDWANSPFATVIITFVFAAYFEKAIIGDPEKASVLWGWAISISSFLIAFMGPILGKLADDNYTHRFWLTFFTILSSIGAALFWFAYPRESLALYVLVLVTLSNTFFELAGVFYNSMLVSFSSKKKVGKLSGQSWAAGYVGGIVCLLIILFGFVQPESPLFGIEKSNAANIRIAGPIVALWFLLFSLPFILSLSKRTITSNIKLKDSILSIFYNLKEIFKGNNKGKFLLARMVYTDGLNTLFAFGGMYAAGTFGMTFSEIIIFGIAINITAGIGALIFSYIDDLIGPKRVIIISLLSIIIIGFLTLIISDKSYFLILGSALGFFIGPVQASSRSFMARYVDLKNKGEIFGLFALSGKVTAFLGPLLLSITVIIFDSQRVGMGSIIIFLTVGFLLLLRVKEPKFL